MRKLSKALDPLTRLPNWLLWRNQDGKKVPFRATRPRRYADVTDSRTWAPFEKACVASKDADGIGFVLTGTPIAAIDLDDVIDTRTGEIDPAVRELIDRGDIYVEITPSQHGLRIIGTASGDPVHRRFAFGPGHVEIYRKAERYITVTGQQIGRCNRLTNIDSLIEELLATDRTDNEKDTTSSGLFHREVCRLADRGKTLDQIEAHFRTHPRRVAKTKAEVYEQEGRLGREIERSYAKWKAAQELGSNGNLSDAAEICLTPAEWLNRNIEPPDRLLADLFYTTARILFSAETGLGKTMLGFAFAFAIHLGRDFLHWRSHRRGRVLYIDGEMPRDLIQERVQLACEWSGVDAPEDGPLILSREDFEEMPPLDTPKGHAWLQRLIKNIGPVDLIIFDNIMSLCQGIMKEEESWQDLKPLVFWLTKQRIGQLWLHHTGHDTSRGYGTKTREWPMDTVMVAERGAQGHIGFELKFPKARRKKPGNQEDFEPVFIEFSDGQWKRNSVTVSRGRPNKTEEIALNALRISFEEMGGPATMGSWRKNAYDLGISGSENASSRATAFQRARKKLLKEGIVVQTGGKFSLSESTT